MFGMRRGYGYGDKRPADDTEFGGMKMVCPEFKSGGKIPKANAMEGGNEAPPIQLRGIPNALNGGDAKAVILIVEDPDAPSEEPFLHCVLIADPIDSPMTDRNTKFFDNGFGNAQYDGPNPPQGSGPHRYVFKAYAMKDRPAAESTEDVLAAIRAPGNVLAKATLIGTYER